MSDPTHEVYEIETLRDILTKIPEGRIDAFLADLRRAHATFEPVRNLLNVLGQSALDTEEDVIEWDGVLYWRDDGQNQQKYNVGDASLVFSEHSDRSG